MAWLFKHSSSRVLFIRSTISGKPGRAASRSLDRRAVPRPAMAWVRGRARERAGPGRMRRAARTAAAAGLSGAVERVNDIGETHRGPGEFWSARRGHGVGLGAV